YAIERFFPVDLLAYDDGPLASELQNRRRDCVSRLVQDFAPSFRSAGKDYLAHLRVFNDELPHCTTRAGNDVNGARRKAGLIDELTKSKVCQGSDDRRLDPHRVAESHSSRKSPSHQLQR